METYKNDQKEESDNFISLLAHNITLIAYSAVIGAFS